MKRKNPTEKQIREAIAKLRKEIREVQSQILYTGNPDPSAAYAAAERAQFAAFELKELFCLESEAIDAQIVAPRTDVAHPPMTGHDGYAPHSHDIRPDHDGVKLLDGDN